MKSEIARSAANAVEGDVFLGENWFDPLEAGARTRIRGFIEDILESEFVAAAALAGATLPVVVNPAQVRAFAKALFDLDVSIDRHRCQRAKTDPIDAAVIARFAEATHPEVRPLPDEATQLLSNLVARRRQIVEMLRAERQRQRRFPDKPLQKSIARLVEAGKPKMLALVAVARKLLTILNAILRHKCPWTEGLAHA